MNAEPFIRVSEVDLFGFGLVYFSTGFPTLNLILGLAPFVFIGAIRILDGPRWRCRTTIWLQSGRWTEAYAGLLQATLGTARRFFGPSWSTQALERCARLALVYGTGYILLAGFAFSDKPGGQEWSYHLGFMIAGGWLGYFSLNRLTGWIDLYFGNGPNSLHWAPERLVRIVVYSLIGLAIGVAQSLGLTIFAIYGFLIGATFTAGFGFVIPTAVVLFLIAGFWGGNIFVFFIMLPFINAIYDWPSWAISRWMMARLREDAQHPKFSERLSRLVTHFLADIFLAVFFLYAFILSIVIMSETNAGISLWERGPFLSSIESPLSPEGLVLNIMLISTLAPTAIHLFFCVFALAFIDTPYRLWISAWLDERRGAAEWGNRALVAGYLTAWAIFSMIVVWIGLEGVFAWLNNLWILLGFAEETDPNPFWASLFHTASFIAERL